MKFPIDKQCADGQKRMNNMQIRLKGFIILSPRIQIHWKALIRYKKYIYIRVTNGLERQKLINMANKPQETDIYYIFIFIYIYMYIYIYIYSIALKTEIFVLHMAHFCIIFCRFFGQNANIKGCTFPRHVQSSAHCPLQSNILCFSHYCSCSLHASQNRLLLRLKQPQNHASTIY